MIVHSYDNLSLYIFTVGCTSKIPPIRYVVVDPNDQKIVDETIGPSARAKAPRERKIPNTVPFWSKLPYFDVSVVMHVTTNAVAIVFFFHKFFFGCNNKRNKFLNLILKSDTRK